MITCFLWEPMKLTNALRENRNTMLSAMGTFTPMQDEQTVKKVSVNTKNVQKAEPD